MKEIISKEAQMNLREIEGKVKGLSIAGHARFLLKEEGEGKLKG